MNLKNASREQLIAYITQQLANFFPDGQQGIAALLEQDIDEALSRIHRCINAVRMWKQDEFDYLHSSQYAIFLYYLANTIWRNRQNQQICNKLFFLNKALNGLDCFYEIEMPDIFFIGHSVGIVLAKATYSDYLVLYQNSTVGKNHGAAPVLEPGVVMYPNTAIIGRALVRERSIISQGVSVINHDTPGNTMVFQGQHGQLLFKKTERDILADIFRL